MDDLAGLLNTHRGPFCRAGVVMFVGRFGGDKDGIDLRKHFRIVKGHGPTASPFIVCEGLRGRSFSKGLKTNP